MIEKSAVLELRDIFDQAIRLDRTYGLGSAAAHNIHRAVERARNYNARKTEPFNDELLHAYLDMEARFRAVTGLFVENNEIKREVPSGG